MDKDQPRCVTGRAKGHQVESIEEESGRTQARPQIMTAILGFGKEFGFESKWDGKLLDGFKEKKQKKKKYDLHFQKSHGFCMENKLLKTQITVGR